jgi:predicted flap endonuclease-1-like 5' DNA nuclease
MGHDLVCAGRPGHAARMNGRPVLIDALGLSSLIGLLVLSTLVSPAHGRAPSAPASAAAVSATAPSSAGSEATAAEPRLIDANHADTDGLQQVRGIGPAIAARIVQERDRRGLFQSLDELKSRVPGIGPNNLARMRAAGLMVSAPPAITPIESAARDRVHMVVGNRLYRPDPRAGGRLVELPSTQAIIAR